MAEQGKQPASGAARRPRRAESPRAYGPDTASSGSPAYAVPAKTWGLAKATAASPAGGRDARAPVAQIQRQQPSRPPLTANLPAVQLTLPPSIFSPARHQGAQAHPLLSAAGLKQQWQQCQQPQQRRPSPPLVASSSAAAAQALLIQANVALSKAYSTATSAAGSQRWQQQPGPPLQGYSYLGSQQVVPNTALATTAAPSASPAATTAASPGMATARNAPPTAQSAAARAAAASARPAELGMPNRPATFCFQQLGASLSPSASLGPPEAAASVDGIQLQQQQQLFHRALHAPPGRLVYQRSESSLTALSSCNDAQRVPSPLFAAAAAHGRAVAVGSQEMLPSDVDTLSCTEPETASPSCCGITLQPMSISQLFFGETATPSPPASSVSFSLGDASSAISQLHEAEEQAAEIVLKARDKALGLRQRAAAEAAAEGQHLQQEMEEMLEAIKEKNKSERENIKKVHAQAQAETTAILAQDKAANMEKTVNLVVDLVLKVDVECPVEAIKLFCSPGALLQFAAKASFQHIHHHPSGELMLLPEKCLTFDGGAAHSLSFGVPDGPRRRSCFGSFWAKHQSKFHSSERPALLLPLPAFEDPFDKDINLRLLSRWETQRQDAESFQPFKLPPFAASSPSSSTPSDDQQDTHPSAADAPVQQQPAADAGDIQPPPAEASAEAVAIEAGEAAAIPKTEEGQHKEA